MSERLANEIVREWSANGKIDAIKNTYVPGKNENLSSLDQESQISNQIKNDEEETSIILEDPNLKTLLF